MLIYLNGINKQNGHEIHPWLSGRYNHKQYASYAYRFVIKNATFLFRSSSMAEQLPVKELVVGSSPTCGAILCQGYGIASRKLYFTQHPCHYNVVICMVAYSIYGNKKVVSECVRHVSH